MVSKMYHGTFWSGKMVCSLILNSNFSKKLALGDFFSFLMLLLQVVKFQP